MLNDETGSTIHSLKLAMHHVYRKHTNFHGHSISWVKFSRGLLFVGKSSQPYLLLLILRMHKIFMGLIFMGKLAHKN